MDRLLYRAQKNGPRRIWIRFGQITANATFGKTMEQVRHRVNVRLICDPNKLANAVSRPTCRCAEIINDLRTTQESEIRAKGDKKNNI